MKQFILLLISTLLLTTSYGQLDKRTWLLGGSGSLYSYHQDYTFPTISYTASYTSVDITPSVGYFIKDKFAGGVRTYFSTYKGEVSGGAVSNQLRFALGPFLRYYFLEKSKQFNLLTDVNYQIGINQARNGGNPKGKFNTFSIMGGTELFFNSSVGLELLLGYRSQLATYDNDVSNYRDARKGFLTSIGFLFHLEKD